MKYYTGDRVSHEVYGEIEITGFRTISDEIELYITEEDEIQDVVSTVQSDKVEFIDTEGQMHVEPLNYFVKHT